MTFGTAFALPSICSMELPNPMPQSTSVNVREKWFGK